MPNRRLTKDELSGLALPLLSHIREKIVSLSRGDVQLAWAIRRKIYKELSFDERRKPPQRKKLKAQKRKEQGNKCALCGGELTARYAVLDRIEAMGGYTKENTRLIHRDCDDDYQRSKGYT